MSKYLFQINLSRWFLYRLLPNETFIWKYKPYSQVKNLQFFTSSENNLF